MLPDVSPVAIKKSRYYCVIAANVLTLCRPEKKKATPANTDSAQSI